MLAWGTFRKGNGMHFTVFLYVLFSDFYNLLDMQTWITYSLLA